MPRAELNGFGTLYKVVVWLCKDTEQTVTSIHKQEACNTKRYHSHLVSTVCCCPVVAAEATVVAEVCVSKQRCWCCYACLHIRAGKGLGGCAPKTGICYGLVVHCACLQVTAALVICERGQDHEQVCCTVFHTRVPLRLCIELAEPDAAAGLLRRRARAA